MLAIPFRVSAPFAKINGDLTWLLPVGFFPNID